MISANELMIGDWVNLSKGNWSENRQVGLIDIEMIAESVYLAEPIHIIPGMLITNGFERQELGGNRVAIWTGFGEDNCHDIEVEFDGDKPIHLKIDGPVYLVTPNIKYVHQLQHFLRDCETGKEIEL